MSVPMKKHLIKSSEIEISVHDGDIKTYKVPKAEAEGILLSLNEYLVRESVPAEIVFKELFEKYGKGGAILRGARGKECLTQIELAKKLRITQGDLSKMEHGKRPIGKQIAKRLAKVLNIDYRVFL